ncbi:hypothetical protein C8Q78DRAFT_1008381 [Trametes maxima]|nr:hypothetical protein C8Q78DRAFT_1008381 [Trametes maxima]
MLTYTGTERESSTTSQLNRTSRSEDGAAGLHFTRPRTAGTPPAPTHKDPGAPYPSKMNNYEARIQALEAEVASLRAKEKVLESRVRYTEAHAALARWQIGGLQEQLNHQSAKKKRKKRTLRTKAICITVGEGLRECEEADRRRAEEEERKRRERERKEQQQEERQGERERLVADTSTSFKGALARKPKPELKDIAYALGLPMEGKNAELVASIIKHLFNSANGLAHCAPKRPLPAEINDENVPPPSQRPRISPAQSPEPPAPQLYPNPGAAYPVFPSPGLAASAFDAHWQSPHQSRTQLIPPVMGSNSEQPAERTIMAEVPPLRARLNTYKY